MTRINASSTARIPRSVWILGFVSLLMDVSSELIHSLHHERGLCRFGLSHREARISHRILLGAGPGVLIASDLVLAQAQTLATVAVGVALWGLHMEMSQGLLATMVAGAAPAQLRGTAFGFFNLVNGVAMLIASAFAGLLWDKLGSAITIYVGAAFSLIALVMLVPRRRRDNAEASGNRETGMSGKS